MLAKASLIILLAATFSGESAYPTACSAPLPGWDTGASGYSVPQPINRIDMRSDGKVLWNGSPVRDEQIVEYTALIREVLPQPFTVLAIDAGVDCGRVKVVRKIIDEGVKCSAGAFCGEGAGPWTTTWDPRQR